ncbi:MAG: cupin domain-containing protein, partial [Candidatus Latescibacterota bacterium]|nr:cupin domain-containing protein [Candidatus Latescibacterota bacterium]
MPFVNPGDLPQLELFPGIVSALASGDNLMLSFLEMEQGAEVAEHSHPHEQAGLVLAGKLRFRIGQEEKVAGPGEAFIIPPNVVHWGVVEEGPAKVLD